MDNVNNTENREENYTAPMPEGETVQDTQSFSQGEYPQPPEWTKNIVVSDKPWIPAGEEGNVSVQFNAPEKSPAPFRTDMYSGKITEKKELPLWSQIGIVVLIALIAVLLTLNVSRMRNPSENVVPTAPASTTAAPTVTDDAPTVVPTTAVPVVNTTTEKNDSKVTTEKEEKTTVKNTEPSVSASSANKEKEKVKKQIVEYFNESSNRVKTEATKVVKNYEKRTHNEEKLKLPSAIKGVAKSVLESKVTDNTEPVEYPVHEAVVAMYPVPGEEWSSRLDADDVAKATCTEKDGEYEITLVLKDCVDPEPGKGTSKAMDCLDVPTVRDTAPEFITAFSAEYYDCVIRCRIEKETGRVIWSNYTTPVLLKVGLDAGFVSFDAEIGLTFEKDYTVTY